MTTLEEPPLEAAYLADPMTTTIFLLMAFLPCMIVMTTVSVIWRLPEHFAVLQPIVT